MKRITLPNGVRIHTSEIRFVVCSTELKIEGDKVAVLDALQDLRKIGEEVGLRHVHHGGKIGSSVAHRE